MKCILRIQETNFLMGAVKGGHGSFPPPFFRQRFLFLLELRLNDLFDAVGAGHQRDQIPRGKSDTIGQL